MQTSQQGIDLIFRFEGKHKLVRDGLYKAYKCPAGIPTIYCGLTRGVYMGMEITEEEGEKLFIKELGIYEDAVTRYVKRPLTQSQFDALVSFVYNVGATAFKKSTLVRELNKGKYDAVPIQLMRWNKATVKGKKITLRGLTRRRKAEADLFVQDDLDETPPIPHMPQKVEPDTGEYKNVVKGSRTFYGALVALFATIGQYISDLFTFGAQVASKAQESLSGNQFLLNMLSENKKEIFIALALCGAAIAVLSRLHDEKEKR